MKTLSPSEALTCPHLAIPQLVLVLALNSIAGLFSAIVDGVILMLLALNSFLVVLDIESFKGLSRLRSFFSKVNIY